MFDVLDVLVERRRMLDVRVVDGRVDGIRVRGVFEFVQETSGPRARIFLERHRTIVERLSGEIVRG